MHKKLKIDSTYINILIEECFCCSVLTLKAQIGPIDIALPNLQSTLRLLLEQVNNSCN